MEILLDSATFEAMLAKARTWFDLYILSWETLAQGSAVLVALALAWAIAPWARRGAKRAITGQYRVMQLVRVEQTLAALSLPFIWLMLLWISAEAADRAGWPYWLIDLTDTLLTAWIVIRIAAAFIRNAAWARIVAIIAWLLAALDVVGLLEPTLNVLDEASMTFGDFRLSALGVIKGVAALAILLWLASLISNVLERRISSLPSLTPSVQVLFSKLLNVLLVTVAIVAALSIVGIDLTAFALFSGAVGVGIGFGLQKAVSNLISGIFLLIDRSVKPGDVIVVGGQYGRINTMSARYTSVITRDGIEHLVPNEDLITQRVENWSFSNNLVRLRTKVGVSYGSDVRLAVSLCVEAAQAADRVLVEPKPVCLVAGFGDSSVDLEIRFWIDDPMNGRANVTSEVLLGVWDRFHEHGVQIPFPQRDLHLKSPEQLRVVTEGAGQRSSRSAP